MGLVDRYWPGLASIVLLGSRIEVIGEVVRCQANAGHDSGCQDVSLVGLYQNEAERGMSVVEIERVGELRRERNESDKEDSSCGMVKVRWARGGEAVSVCGQDVGSARRGTQSLRRPGHAHCPLRLA